MRIRKQAAKLAVSIGLLAAGCGGKDNGAAGTNAPVTMSTLAQGVTVRYDAQGIPHIGCAAANDCYAVQGYLHARDRLFQMDVLRRTARGTLAELVGPSALAQDVQLRTLFTARDGSRIEDDLVAPDVMDPATRATIDAYVGGVNAYLATLRSTGAALPGEYGKLPLPVTAADIPDWTAADVAALARLQQFQLSETIEEEQDYAAVTAAYGPGGAHQDLGLWSTWVRSARPSGARANTIASAATSSREPRQRLAVRRQRRGRLASGAVVSSIGVQALAPIRAWQGALASAASRLAVLHEALAPLAGYREALGSNNWAVDAAHSANGHAMVANDPHLSLQYPPNFYLASLTSTNPADNLDLSGGSFPGLPGAQVGRGRSIAWGVTVVGYDVTDLYLEQVAPCPPGTPAQIPLCVLAGGQATPVLPVPQTFRVRTGDGLVDAQTLPEGSRPPVAAIIVPAHGPLVQAPDGSGRAVSVRWTGQETWTQDLHAILAFGTASNVDTAFAALEGFATGAQNFVFADETGRIAYYAHALVPVRRFADPTVVGAAVQPPWLPLHGYDGSAEWGSGDPADHCAGLDLSTFPPTRSKPAAACWIPSARLPQGKDPARGFFATANSDPLGVTDDNNPLAHPPYLSFDWDDHLGLRATRIIDRLTALTASGKVALPDMQALQADHVSTFGQLLLAAMSGPALDEAAGSDAKIAAARQVLAAWASAGYDCPTGLTGVDPTASAPDPDPTVTAQSAGCYLFHAFARALLTTVFSDELKVAGAQVLDQQAARGMLAMLQGEADPGFCRDVDASGAVTANTTCAQQVARALAGAYDALTAGLGDKANWRWGRVHTMQPVSQSPLVVSGFRPGPFARPGGAYTVDVGTPSLTTLGASFAFTSSGNVRHISVLDPQAPIVDMQLPGPERSAPSTTTTGSSTSDLLGQWLRNQYFVYPHASQINSATSSTQQFTPLPPRPTTSLPQ